MAASYSSSSSSSSSTFDPNPNPEWAYDTLLKQICPTAVSKNPLDNVTGTAELFLFTTGIDEKRLESNSVNSIQTMTKQGSVRVGLKFKPRSFMVNTTEGEIRRAGDFPVKAFKLQDVLYDSVEDMQKLGELLPSGNFSKSGLLAKAEVTEMFNPSPFHLEFGIGQTRSVLGLVEYLTKNNPNGEQMPKEISEKIKNPHPILSVVIPKTTGTSEFDRDVKELYTKHGKFFEVGPKPLPIFSGYSNEISTAVAMYAGVNEATINRTITSHSGKKGYAVTTQESLAGFWLRTLKNVTFVYDAKKNGGIPMNAQSSVFISVPNVIMSTVRGYIVEQAKVVKDALNCHLPSTTLHLQCSHMHDKWEFDPENEKYIRKMNDHSIRVLADQEVEVGLTLSFSMIYPRVTDKSVAMSNPLARSIWNNDIWPKEALNSRGQIKSNEYEPFDFTVRAKVRSEIQKEQAEQKQKARKHTLEDSSSSSSQKRNQFHTNDDYENEEINNDDEDEENENENENISLDSIKIEDDE